MRLLTINDMALSELLWVVTIVALIGIATSPKVVGQKRSHLPETLTPLPVNFFIWLGYNLARQIARCHAFSLEKKITENWSVPSPLS